MSPSRPAGVVISALLAIAVLALPRGAGERNDGFPLSTVRVTIMPLGDSITDGFDLAGGYRIELARSLREACVPFNFVGSQSNGPASLRDRDHEGHSGWRIDEILAQIPAWLREYEPRIVLLLIGTNDVVQAYRLAEAPARLDALVGAIAAGEAARTVFVSSLPPLADLQASAAAEKLNLAIPGIVERQTRRGRAVRFVDLHARLSTSDLSDGVHPSRAGYAKLAAGWYDAIRRVLDCPEGRCPAAACSAE